MPHVLRLYSSEKRVAVKTVVTSVDPDGDSGYCFTVDLDLGFILCEDGQVATQSAKMQHLALCGVEN